MKHQSELRPRRRVLFFVVFAAALEAFLQAIIRCTTGLCWINVQYVPGRHFRGSKRLDASGDREWQRYSVYLCNERDAHRRERAENFLGCDECYYSIRSGLFD